jgi:phosphatidylethanolamine-binding protein (PEBP) family uncharacterized protein
VGRRVALIAAILVAAAACGTPGASPVGVFTLTSPVMTQGGTLPVRFTCDGTAETPPLAWSGAPRGTASYAIVMHTVPGPGQTHWYWVLYDIAPSVDHVDANATPPAQVGTNSVNGRIGYAPPCSKGPGPKLYTFTVYALSGRSDLPDPAAVSRPVLLDALSRLVLAEAHLDVTYKRPGTGGAAAPPAPPAPPGAPTP